MEVALVSNLKHERTLMLWWEQHSGHKFNPHMISSHQIMVSEKGKPICLCFVYFPSNSKLCQVAFITRDPAISEIKAGKALKLLISFAVHACRELGYSVIYTASANQTVQKLCKKSGFIVDEKSSLEAIKEL